MRYFIRWIARLLYGFRAFNESALNVRGPVLLLANHVSWWDWVFLGVCLEEDWRFATSSATAELSWLHRRIMVNRRTFPVDMNSPYAVKHMAEFLQHGGRLVLFPEGRISCTGSLMKLFDGTGFLIFKTKPKVITAYIRGAERLPLSKNPNRKRWFPHVSVHFSNMLVPPQLGAISVTEARTRLTNWLRDRMIQQRFETEMAFGPQSIPGAIAEAVRRAPAHIVVEDASTRMLSYRRLLRAADALSLQWRGWPASPSEPVGVLLPNMNAYPVTLLSLWLADKTPALLNYTTGPSILLTCARLAGLKRIITSEEFVLRAGIDLEPLRNAGIEIVLLEPVRRCIKYGQKAAALFRSLLGLNLSGADKLRSDRTAAILFTSGSEGDPKGVQLTHANLLANIRQMLSVIDLMDTDRFFNALPLFHSFGFTVGLLLPLVTGSFVCLYVSPLHYRVVPSAFYNLNCTIFFGTNTFLAGYARKAHPYDFRSLRYVFAGAEALQPSTETLWLNKFGIRILQGYGATECGPCLTVNVPMHPHSGSAGQFLPGIDHRFEPVEGLEPAVHGANQGRLWVKGPNVMRGYLNPDANAKFKAQNGWYDTGDIARVDHDGFVYILGRLKRFAKISGEMVSLAAVEDALAAGFPQYGSKFALAVIARPDEHKGEKLIAISNQPRLTLEEIRQVIRSRGLSNLALPREIRLLPAIPRLGSGKINYRELEILLRQQATNSAA
ncbi:MAG TPA: AMP-binding protein [Candidatus Limnocylindrales bacterium]|jgi:acyl-[acyl-carrier-protein]-phospholipid O-acyltransferase/long-chain-fatty-acid--[acyl-carrier-protein] ligase|nr:AMP-binding protein [Candidatus Limnocylindrales bacterium]